MLLWCHGGSGDVEVNGVRYPIDPDLFYFMPWNHHVVYHPCSTMPLMLSGIHLIPDLPPGEPVYFSVPHHPRERFKKTHIRRDARIPELDGLVHGIWQSHTTLCLLAEYILHWYRREVPTEEAARWLARQLIGEIRLAGHGTVEAAPQLPERLQRILGHIWNHLHLPLGADELAAQGRCTPSTVQRLFTKYLNDNPTSYIQKRRMEKAAYLLADTVYSIAEIGRLVGIRDPYYFSKLFRKVHGITASEYRRHKVSSQEFPEGMKPSLPYL